MAVERLEFDILARTASARRDMNAFADSVDDVDDSFADLTKGSKALDAEIGRLTRSTKDLQLEFRKTGDLDLLKAVKKDQSAIRQLEKMRAMLGEVVEEAGKAGVKSGEMFGGLFSRAVGSPMTLGLAGAAAAATPLIVTAVGGAVVAGVASAGVAAGLAGAFQDPDVKAAAAELGGDIRDDFLVAAKVFRKPALDAIADVRNEWRHMLRPEIEATLNAAAELVDPLLDAATGFVSGLLPGVRSMIEDADPLMDVLKQDLPAWGRVIGDTFETIGEHSDALATGMHDVMVLVEGTTAAAGFFVSYLSEAWNIARNFTPITLLADATSGDDLARMMRRVGDETDDTTRKLVSQTQALHDLATAYRTAFDQTMSVEQANLNYQKRLDDLTESVKEHGRSLDANKRPGQANKQALFDLAEAAIRTRDANLRNGMSVDVARAKFEAQRAEVLRLARSLKLPQAEVQALINKLLGIPTSLTSTVRVKFISDTKSWAPPSVGRNVGQYIAMSQGGLVGGTGPSGVDSQLRMLAPDEWVMPRWMQQLYGGAAELERVRRGGPATAGGYQTAAAAGGMQAWDYGQFADVIERSMERAFSRVLGRAPAGPWNPGRAADLLGRGG